MIIPYYFLISVIKLLPDARETSQNNLIYFCDIRYDANYYLERFGPKTQDVLGGEEKKDEFYRIEPIQTSSG